MRVLWLIVLLLAVGQGSPVSETLVLYSDPHEKPVRIASLTLQLALDEDAALEQLFAVNGVQLGLRKYGEFYALVAAPVRSLKTRNALIMAMGGRYPGMFFVMQSTATAASRAQTRLVATAPIPSRKAGSKMTMIDWVWLAVFLLALVGLTSSILQRKRLMRFSREQIHLRKDQERMDESIESLQGDQHD